MTQNDFHRAVARATGETVSEIARRGFQPLSTAGSNASIPDQAHSPDESCQIQPARYEPVAA